MEIVKILKLIVGPAYTLFCCDKIAAKAITSATERIAALGNLGFEHSEENLIGHDVKRYGSYYVKKV